MTRRGQKRIDYSKFDCAGDLGDSDDDFQPCSSPITSKKLKKKETKNNAQVNGKENKIERKRKTRTSNVESLFEKDIQNAIKISQQQTTSRSEKVKVGGCHMQEEIARKQDLSDEEDIPKKVKRKIMKSTIILSDDEVEPTQPVSQVEPTQPVSQVEPTQPVTQVEPTQPVTQIEPIQSITQVEPIHPVTQRVGGTMGISQGREKTTDKSCSSLDIEINGTSNNERIIFPPIGTGFPPIGTGKTACLLDTSEVPKPKSKTDVELKELRIASHQDPIKKLSNSSSHRTSVNHSFNSKSGSSHDSFNSKIISTNNSFDSKVKTTNNSFNSRSVGKLRLGLSRNTKNLKPLHRNMNYDKL